MVRMSLLIIAYYQFAGSKIEDENNSFAWYAIADIGHQVGAHSQILFPCDSLPQIIEFH